MDKFKDVSGDIYDSVRDNVMDHLYPHEFVPLRFTGFAHWDVLSSLRDDAARRISGIS